MSSDNKSEKNPYKDHSLEDVMKAESGSFYIQIGEGMFQSENGKLAFNKERADDFFMAAWEGLKEMKQKGSPQEQEEAMRCLLNFRIIPLRFH